jgi:hypothetical protein
LSITGLRKEKMTKSEVAKLGQAGLRRKLGDRYSDYMTELGKRGFHATIIALAERQNIPANLNYNPFRNLLHNLKAKGGNNGS